MRVTANPMAVEMPSKDEPEFVKLRLKLDHSEEIINVRLSRSHPAYKENLDLLMSAIYAGNGSRSR